MKKQFSKELDEKFLADIGNMEYDTESELEDSFFTEEKERIQREIQQNKNKASQRKKLVLQQIKNEQEKDKKLIEDFENDMGDVIRITKGEQKNVIDEGKLQEIKKQIFEKKINIVLSDEVIKEKQINNNSTLRKSILLEKDKRRKIDKKIKEDDEKIQFKMDKMYQQREILAMTRQDNLSMKYEEEYHSQLLSARLYTPKLFNIYQKDISINFHIAEPCFTLSNLRPQLNTQNNVLSKHSKELAFKNLRLLTKSKHSPLSIVQKNIQLKKVQKNIKFKQQQPLNIIEQTDQKDRSQILFNLLKQYFLSLIQPLQHLKLVSQNNQIYQPKFINQFLEGDQKAVNIDLNETKQEKSLDNIIRQFDNKDRLKQLKLTFEKLISITSIKQLISLEYIEFQFNKLNEIQQLRNNTKLIEINISNNQLQSYKGIQNLKWLKCINVQKNKIGKLISFLSQSLLEYFDISYNRIKRIQGLQYTHNLRQLNLSNNQITHIEGLERLYFLNQLNLSYNKLRSIKNLNKCIMLKNLILNNNLITQFQQDLILVFLSELNLNSNQIVSFQKNIILPSLQHLYLQHNYFRDTSKSIIYLPNLKILNIDENNLQHFSPIWQIVKYSYLLEMIKYDNNDGLRFLQEKIKQLYEHMLYRKMKCLKILNQSEYNVGIKRYYESLYEILLEPYKEETGGELKGFQEKVSFLLKQNRFIEMLEKAKNTFIKTYDFQKYKSGTINKTIVELIKLIKQERAISYFLDSKSIFYKYDNYQLTLKKSLHKIKGLLIRYKYKKNKRRNYFKKNKNHILELFQFIKSTRQVYFAKYTINKFKETNLNKYAVVIQKVWKGFILRKKMKKLLENIKVKKDNDDIEQLEEPDIDFFYQPVEEYQLKFPENIDIPIIRPEIFQKADTLVKTKTSQNISKPPQKNLKSNNLMRDSKSSNMTTINLQNIKKNQLPPVINKRDSQKKIMQDWGFKNQATAFLLQQKKNKKLKQMKLYMQQHMTPTEKYERIMRQGKK